jgi:hypothetical protein
LFIRTLPLVLLVALAASTTPSRGVGPYSIVDIRAHLYHQETGIFDPTDVTSAGSSTLWNTIIGEGSAKTPSAATLVLVKLNGSWLASAHPPRLRVIVQIDSGGPVLLRQTNSLDDLFSEGATVWVPFIVLGTGCGTTRIVATLVDTRGVAQDSVTKRIPFLCGE